MRKLLIILGCLALSLSLMTGAAWAQNDGGDDTTGPAATGPTSTINYFVLICEDRAIVEFSGTMQAGFDVYYRIFSGSRGSGAPLTDLRRVSVNGAYDVTETITYTGGTIPAGTVGSAYVAIAATNNSDNVVFSDFVDDVQDGCREPAGQTVPGGDTTPADPSVSTPATDPATTTTTGPRRVVEGRFTDTGTSAILSPFGGYINPNYIPPDKPLVQVGAAEDRTKPRQETPGIIFAECLDYPVAEPGILYDTDNVVVFWSWFTVTEQQMLNHITNVDYSVTYYQTLPLPNPQRSEVRRIGNLYWVFYYSVLGNLLPGDYYIEYKVEWGAPHFDGLDNYGPRTDNPMLESGCFFRILPNPEGRPVSHNSWPYRFLGDQ